MTLLNSVPEVSVWVDGHVHGFAFFGRVPQSVLYDNDRCLVAKILPDGPRKRTKLFTGFRSHYFINDRYGRPGKGNDKGALRVLSVSAEVFMTIVSDLLKDLSSKQLTGR